MGRARKKARTSAVRNICPPRPPSAFFSHPLRLPAQSAPVEVGVGGRRPREEEAEPPVAAAEGDEEPFVPQDEGAEADAEDAEQGQQEIEGGNQAVEMGQDEQLKLAMDRSMESLAEERHVEEETKLEIELAIQVSLESLQQQKDMDDEYVQSYKLAVLLSLAPFEIPCQMPSNAAASMSDVGGAAGDGCSSKVFRNAEESTSLKGKEVIVD